MDGLGRQVLADLYGCDRALLEDPDRLESVVVQAALDAGATVIDTAFHRFSPYGVSGVVVIQESHLAVHTWPERGFAAVDVFTCSDSLDPEAACRAISDALDAEKSDIQHIDRGKGARLTDAASTPTLAAASRGPETPSSYLRSVWFTERDDDIALSLRHAGALLRVESEIQRVEVLNSSRYGRLLALDGAVAFTEQDEYIYHEMIVHPAVLAHGNVRKALVIGGGDGGACRELLRHPSVEAVTVAEIDPVVVDACREHFAPMASSLDDGRSRLETGDGGAYLGRQEDGSLDLIVIDAGGAAGSAGPLSTASFYAEARRCLRADGVLCAQAPRPVLDSNAFRSTFGNVRSVFGQDHVHCFLAAIPSFTTGLVSFALATCAGADPSEPLDRDLARSFARLNGLRYYTPDIHAAAFVLPGFIVEMLAEVS